VTNYLYNQDDSQRLFTNFIVRNTYVVFHAAFVSLWMFNTSQDGGSKRKRFIIRD